MRTLKMTLAYEGTRFSGWQVQPGRRTVQGEIEKALTAIEGAPVRIHGSGRTDAGVHALGQVASFELHNAIPCFNLRRALNRTLPPAIRALEIEEAPAGFHARIHATAKTYEYRMYREEVCPPFERRYVHHIPYPLDEQAMIAAAPLLVGEKDFRSFATGNGEHLESTIRTIFSSQMERRGPRLIYRVRGSGFLYNMVRNIVGTLVWIGRGVITTQDLDRILAERDRRSAGPTAPAPGLFLESVEYDRPID